MSGLRHAVILAAGEGRRLRPLTATLPKPLVPVAGEAMLDRAMRLLREAGVERFTIVVGHLEQVLRQHLRPAVDAGTCRVVSNPRYADTNSMFSLLLGLAAVDEASWIVEGDVVFEPAMLDAAPTAPLNWIVDGGARHLDGAFVLSDERGFASEVRIIRDLEKIPPVAGKSVGMLRADSTAVGWLREWLSLDLLERREGDYYDLVLSRRLPHPGVRTLDIAGARWYEVDNEADLGRAERLFA